MSFAAKDLDKLEAQEYVRIVTPVHAVSVIHICIAVTGLPRSRMVSASSYSCIQTP